MSFDLWHALSPDLHDPPSGLIGFDLVHKSSLDLHVPSVSALVGLSAAASMAFFCFWAFFSSNFLVASLTFFEASATFLAASFDLSLASLASLARFSAAFLSAEVFALSRAYFASLARRVDSLLAFSAYFMAS